MKHIKTTIATMLLTAAFAGPVAAQLSQQQITTGNTPTLQCVNICQETVGTLRAAAAALRFLGNRDDNPADKKTADYLDKRANRILCPAVCGIPTE